MKSRNYGLDIARIVAIIGIITLHINGAGGIIDASPIGTETFWVVQWVEILAFCSVDLFALLSGYLGITSQEKSSKRAIELLSISVLYCTVISLGFLVFYPDHMNLKSFVIGLFPILKNRYWYLYCYIPLAILQPYINSFIRNLSLRQHIKLILFLVITFSIVPSFIAKDTMGLNYGYSFMWLFICYFIGAYIKRQENERKRYSLRWGLLYLVLSLVLLSGNYLVFSIASKYVNYFVSYISPFVLLMAISLLVCFKNMEFKSPNHKVLEIFSILSL